MVDRDRLTPQEHAAAAASWSRDSPVPDPHHPDRLVLLLDTLRGLSTVRRQVRTFLASGLADGAGDAGEDAVERAVLVIDELTSNALRHGRPPSRLQVCDDQDRWIVIVGDSAPERLPTPAVHRPAGEGGYGLHVVSDLSAAHGVHCEGDQKLVWVCLDKPAG